MLNDTSQRNAGLCLEGFGVTTKFNRHICLDSSAIRHPSRRDARRDNPAFQDRLRQGDPAASCREQSSQAERDKDGPAAVAAKRESAAAIQSRPVLRAAVAKGDHRATSQDARRWMYRHRYLNPQANRV